MNPPTDPIAGPSQDLIMDPSKERFKEQLKLGMLKHDQPQSTVREILSDPGVLLSVGSLAVMAGTEIYQRKKATNARPPELTSISRTTKDTIGKKTKKPLPSTKDAGGLGLAGSGLVVLGAAAVVGLGFGAYWYFSGGKKEGSEEEGREIGDVAADETQKEAEEGAGEYGR